MRSENEHDHYFTGFYSAANQHMAKEAFSGILIERLHFKAFEQAADAADNFLAFFVLDKAFVHLDDIVASFLIGSADDIAFFVFSKSGSYLVAVKTRIAHSENSVDFSEPSEEFFLVFLFYLKLFRVRYTGIAASAAFSCNNAYAWHKDTSF